MEKAIKRRLKEVLKRTEELENFSERTGLSLEDDTITLEYIVKVAETYALFNIRYLLTGKGAALMSEEIHIDTMHADNVIYKHPECHFATECPAFNTLKQELEKEREKGLRLIEITGKHSTIIEHIILHKF
jgi:hypothetical protein